tara:strand:- start:1719 stop:1820 length:102 start_codon:yes stop_codon:yes gene_type:complete
MTKNKLKYFQSLLKKIQSEIIGDVEKANQQREK